MPKKMRRCMVQVSIIDIESSVMLDQTGMEVNVAEGAELRLADPEIHGCGDETRYSVRLAPNRKIRMNMPAMTIAGGLPDAP